MSILDQTDQAILRARQTAFDQRPGPRVGDWVEFPDNIRRRISYLWPDGAQTSDGGTYYLGDGYISMSGSLHRTVPLTSLTPTNRVRRGDVWFFHHDYPTGGGGVDTIIPCRVFTCALPAPH